MHRRKFLTTTVGSLAAAASGATLAATIPEPWPFSKLTPFLSEYRAALSAPLFLADGRVVASDGRIMLRLPGYRLEGQVPGLAEIEEAWESTRIGHCLTAAQFGRIDPRRHELVESVTWKQLRERHPELVSPIATRAYDCPTCEGRGRYAYPDMPDITWPCMDCEGEKQMIEEDTWHVRIGDSWFLWSQMERFSLAPGDTDRIIFQAWRCTDDPYHHLPLEAILPDDWGDGFLSPLRPETPHPTDTRIHHVGWC